MLQRGTLIRDYYFDMWYVVVTEPFYVRGTYMRYCVLAMKVNDHNKFDLLEADEKEYDEEYWTIYPLNEMMQKTI